ncbi:hypothetical protein FACS1894139_12730 [Planctomycetales bacterium]|nr:hypothetical protein FACS1894108_07640 [Planctomycetales bacterium]GHT06571.1 hypothetical protein FACS1894139_12730 [Planctomycetales bacterium]
MKKLRHNVLVLLLGLGLGLSCRVAYEMLFYDDVYWEADDLPGETELTVGGALYGVLPFAPATHAESAAIAALLPTYQIDFLRRGERLFVRSEQMPLALDLLHAAGFSGDTRNFSALDITANPQTEPRRYRLQKQLAAQNLARGD